MEQSGLLSWANGICLTMASDPGRQVFKDQVQTHGFVFLEDYLDNIVSGAKADPLIELVKTPGRKKAVARKPKLMSSKLAINVFAEEKHAEENIAPNNMFQTALQRVQNHKVTSEGLKNEVSLNDLERSNIGKATRSPFAAIQPLPNAQAASEVLAALIIPVIPFDAIEQANVEYNDLSVIAEDDEPLERSRMNISTPVVIKPMLFDELPKPIEEAIPNEMDITTTSSADTLHSIPLDSPPQQRPYEPDVPLYISQSADKGVDGASGDIPSNLAPTASASEIQDYLMADSQEEDEVGAPDNKPDEKHIVPSFPTLPEPMPLRKSIRPPRDPSLSAVMLGAATPGAPVGGKRTSWLMKAREIKALEGPPKKSTVSPNLNLGSGNALIQGIKRKSEDTNPKTPTTVEESERQSKVAKLYDGEMASRMSKDIQLDQVSPDPTTILLPPQDVVQHDDSLQQGVLDRLKKTVEGLGVRVSKTMGKSVGGGTATALAEARAAAEARVAERDRKEEEMTMAMGMPAAMESDRAVKEQTTMPSTTDVRQSGGRLSISDLFPSGSRIKEKHKVPEKPFHFAPSFVPTSAKKGKENNTLVRERTSTTPPHSPPLLKNRALPPAPVFNKPPPVFVPPPPISSAPLSTVTMPSVFSAPPIPKYTMPPSMALRFSPHVESPSSRSKGKTAAALSAQSTLESVVSSNLFDRDDISPWAPSTQDTEYTSAYQSQPQPGGTQICDEDDSWPIDEKFAAGVHWTYGASKDDSMTWSTLPSQSQRGDTGPLSTISPPERSSNLPPTPDVNINMNHDTDTEDEDDFEHRDLELEDIIMDYPKATVALVEPKIPRSQSQMSMASSESVQSQSGFLGQASKLLSSALGTTKKKQPEVKKVLQMAASAAKKQQEEADKKATRLKEMENRRQQALQRKAEEERANTLEEERKLKEESERRKKEREDLTDKRAIKASSSKREEDTTKKGKVESEKKQEIKKPLIGKSHLKGVLKQPSTSNLNSLVQPPAAEPSPSLHKGKGVAQQAPMDDEVSQPSQLVQSQMAARAKAQIQAASKQMEPRVASESIELPDINSEYSDSEDEDRPRTFDPPEWAQSPELRQILEMQSTINPDDIFGAVRPLKMEEIFKTKTSRFRPRSSSANWTGTDRLTLQEEKDYARRMGFK